MAIKAFNTNRACRVSAVSFCKARGEEGEHSFPMEREVGKNVWGVSMGAPDNPHVLSWLRERDWTSRTDADRRDDLGKLCHELPVWRREGQQLGLLRHQSHVVLLAVFDGEEEEKLEAEYVMGEEDAVISLADAGHESASKVDSKV